MLDVPENLCVPLLTVTPPNAAAADILLTPSPPKKNRSARGRRRSKSPGAPPPKYWRRRRALVWTYDIRGTISHTTYLREWTSDWQFGPHTVTWGQLIEHGLTSAPTQYRLHGRRFLQVKRPNQQYQSTEGWTLQCAHHTNHSSTTITTVYAMCHKVKQKSKWSV